VVPLENIATVRISDVVKKALQRRSKAYIIFTHGYGSISDPSHLKGADRVLYEVLQQSYGDSMRVRSIEVDSLVSYHNYFDYGARNFIFTTMDMVAGSSVILFNSYHRIEDHKLTNNDPITFDDESKNVVKEKLESLEEIRSNNYNKSSLYFEHPGVAFLFSSSDIYCREVYSFVEGLQPVNTKYRATLLCLYRDAQTMASNDRKEEELT